MSNDAAVVGKLEVEVQGLNGAFYRAYVLDLVENDVVISFEDNWLPNKRVPVSRIRLPDHSEPEPTWEGTEDVEVLSRAKDTEACGWWPAIILEWTGGTDICTIQYKVDKNFTEMVNINRLRMPNKNPPLQAESFFKCVIEVPEEVQHACEDIALHRDLLHACRADVLRGDNKTGTLTLLSTSSETVTRARMLADLHVRSLQTKVMLKQRGAAAAAASSLMGVPPVTRPFALPETPQNPRLVMEQFSIEASLMGLAIGTKGSNIQQCRSLPGIHSIEVNEHTCTFKITGLSTHEVLEAKKRLQYTCEIVYIPKAYTGRVIGKNGQKIQEIVAKSNVLRVSIESEDENGQVPFQFTGLKDAVETAKIILEYQLANFKELEALVSPTSRNPRFSPVSPGGSNPASAMLPNEFSPEGALFKDATVKATSRSGMFPQPRLSSASSVDGQSNGPASSGQQNGGTLLNGHSVHEMTNGVAPAPVTLTNGMAALSMNGKPSAVAAARAMAVANGAYPPHPRTNLRSMSLSSSATSNAYNAPSSARRCASTATLPEDNDYTPSSAVVVSVVNGSGQVLGSTGQPIMPATATAATAAANDAQPQPAVAAEAAKPSEVTGVAPESNKENVDLSVPRKAEVQQQQQPASHSEAGMA